MHARLKFNKKLLAKLPGLQKEARFQGNIVLYRRTTAIMMLSLNTTQLQIANTLGVCREVITRWGALFLAKGPDGLRPKKPRGRKSKISQEEKNLLKEQIQAGPTEHGYPGGVWTSPMLQEHIQKQFNVLYSVGYIPQLLRSMGLSHIKPKYTFTLSRDEFKEQIRWVRKTLPDLYERVKREDGVLLFQDEATCQLQPNVMATWAPKGKPPTEEKNSKRGSLKIFGTIELYSGKLLYSIQDKKLTNAVFAQFLRQVANHYKGKKVFIVVDGAPYHRGPTLRRFLRRNGNIELVRQPAKSPNLNPIEKVWKELKKDRTHNVYFKDKGALKRALRRGLHSLQQSEQRVRSLMGKWERLVENPGDALLGLYDSSLVPKKYQEEFEEIRREVSNEIAISLLQKENLVAVEL